MKISVRILSPTALPMERATLDRQIEALPFGKTDTEELLNKKHLPSLARSLAARRALWDLLTLRNIPPRPILRTSDGKPYFEGGSAPSFSLSHTENFAVAALSEEETPLGVDIEQLSSKRKTDALARRYFSSEELTRWERSPNKDQEFLRIWTEKEALSKCDGRGLSLLLKTEPSPSYHIRTFLLQKNESIALLSLCSPKPISEVSWHTDKGEIQIQERF